MSKVRTDVDRMRWLLMHNACINLEESSRVVVIEAGNKKSRTVIVAIPYPKKTLEAWRQAVDQLIDSGVS